VTDRVPGSHTLLLFRPNTCLPDLFHCGLLFTAVHYGSYVQMNRFERQQQMLSVSPPSICLVPSFYCRTHSGRHHTGSCLVCTVSKVSPKIYIQTHSRRSHNMILRGSPEQLSTCDFPLHLVGSTECHWLCRHIQSALLFCAGRQFYAIARASRIHICDLAPHKRAQWERIIIIVHTMRIMVITCHFYQLASALGVSHTVL
jgi:hypothetical protein